MGRFFSSDAEALVNQAPPPGVPPELVEFAHAIAKSANVAAVFGAPIYQGDRTFIPIAQARLGLGSGDSLLGKAAGGGMTVKPMGYIVIDKAGARFRRSPQPSSMSLVFGLGVFVGMALAIRLMGRRRAPAAA